MAKDGLTDWVLRAPEEYPKNLGLGRPEFLRTNFDHIPIILQADRSYREFGFVQVVAFWGVGWRHTLTSVDRLGMAHHALLCSHLQRALLRGVRLTFLLSDNHGFANEVPLETISRYYAQIEHLGKEFNFSTRRLSTIHPFRPEEIQHLQPTSDELQLFKQMREPLEKSARNVNPINAERRALQYFIVRLRECSDLRAAFPYAILANSDVPTRSVLAPQLPTFWIHPLPGKRWRKHKPWFLHQQHDF